MLLQMFTSLLLKALNLKLIHPEHDQNFLSLNLFRLEGIKTKRGEAFAFPRFFYAFKFTPSKEGVKN